MRCTQHKATRHIHTVLQPSPGVSFSQTDSDSETPAPVPTPGPRQPLGDPGEPRMRGIREDLSFCNWLISRSFVSSRLLRVWSVSGCPSFLRVGWIPACGQMPYCVSVHPLMATWGPVTVGDGASVDTGGSHTNQASQCIEVSTLNASEVSPSRNMQRPASREKEGSVGHTGLRSCVPVTGSEQPLIPGRWHLDTDQRLTARYYCAYLLFSF